MLDKAGITDNEPLFAPPQASLLQHLAVHAPRPESRAKPAAASQPTSRLILNGFSPNVQDILDNFEFRNQIPTLSKADALGTLIEKFLDPEINLSPEPVLNGDGT